MQTALIQTLGSWRRLRAPENAEAYTRTTMLRLAGRAARRRWRQEVPAHPLPDALPRPARDPTTEVDEADRVHRALQALPWQQRTVLVLRYSDDRSEAETAALLGCSTGTVKSRGSGVHVWTGQELIAWGEMTPSKPESGIRQQTAGLRFGN